MPLYWNQWNRFRRLISLTSGFLWALKGDPKVVFTLKLTQNLHWSNLHWIQKVVSFLKVHWRHWSQWNGCSLSQIVIQKVASEIIEGDPKFALKQWSLKVIQNVLDIVKQWSLKVIQNVLDIVKVHWSNWSQWNGCLSVCQRPHWLKWGWSKNIEDCFFFITSKGYQKGTTKEKVDFGGHAECYSSMLLLKSLVVLSNVGSCYCYLADKKLQVKREKPDFAGHAEY